MTTDYETYKATLEASAHNLHGVATRYSPDPGFIIPGWLPADTERLLISGPAKAGKSWLAHELVFSLGTGQPFLGVFDLEYQEHVPVPGDPRAYQTETKYGMRAPETTVYIQQENSMYSMETRHRSILLDRGGEEVLDEDGNPDIVGIDDRNIALVHRLDLNLFNNVHLETLVEKLNVWEARNLVLDSIYRCMPGTLNDESMAKELILRLEHLMKYAKVRIIALHHASTKGDSGGQKFKEAMGSTFFTSAWPDLEWRMHRGKDKVTSVDFIARDHALSEVEVRMVEPGSWIDITANDVSLDDFQAYLDDNHLVPVRRGKGWSFNDATQGEVAAALGTSQSQISRLIGLMLIDTEEVDDVE